MIYNAIFKKQSSLTFKAEPLSSNTDVTIGGYWVEDDTADVGYKDLTKIGLSRGDTLFFYDKFSKDIKRLGVISDTATISTRITLNAIENGEEAYQSGLSNGFLNVFVYFTDTVVSYPLHTYRGARSNNVESNKNLLETIQTSKGSNVLAPYSSSLISLFFERTSGHLDEIRIEIEEGTSIEAIEHINKNFRNVNGHDLVFEPGKFLKTHIVLKRIQRILSSISNT